MWPYGRDVAQQLEALLGADQYFYDNNYYYSWLDRISIGWFMRSMETGHGSWLS